MKYLSILLAVFMFFPVFADSDIEPQDDFEEELPDEDFSLEDDGAGLSITTAVKGGTVIYGRVFYNYITNYSRGRIYIYEQIGDTDEFAFTGQIPADREKTSYFGGYVGMLQDSIITLNAIYARATLNDKQVDIYKKNEDSVYSHYKTVELPENYDVAGKGFATDSGTFLVAAHNMLTGADGSEIFVYSDVDDYTSHKSIFPANFDKDLHRFFFPRGLDISGDTIVATSTSLEEEYQSGPTSIHIFSKDPESGEWTETQTITSNFGESVKAYYGVSISGDRFIVQAFLDEKRTQGSAQIFQNRGGTWHLIKEILPPEGAKNHFGWNVSMGTDFAVVTDKGNSKSLPYGTTYVFHKDYDPEIPDARTDDNWGLFKKFEVTDESVSPLMGSVAVIDGDTLSMGAAPSIFKKGEQLTPYIEKLSHPKFNETEENDETETNDDPEKTDNDPDEETEDTESVQKKESRSGCSVILL